MKRWVQFWDRHEPGDSLACVRIGVGAVLLFDLWTTARLGLVTGLWAPVEEGGFGPSAYDQPGCVLYEWLGASSGLAWWLFVISMLSSATLCLGLFTRTSAACLVLAYAQLSQLQSAADRGIDMLLRNVCVLLACSGAGVTLSCDALRATGRWRSDRLVPAWPRYCLVLQLAVVYFQAGMLKQSPQWTSLDGYSALSVVLQRPHFARLVLPSQLMAALYPLLQLATFVTVLFERGALFMPLLVWLEETRHRGGRLRRWLHRSRLLPLWAATGLGFHLGLVALLQLGIFPWGCMAIYPALVSPLTLRRVVGGMTPVARPA